MAGITGGSIFFHPRFDAHRDTPRLREELSRLLASDVVYNCALRLRCSNGGLSWRGSELGAAY